MSKEWLSQREEEVFSLKNLFMAVKTKTGWTTIFFKIKDISEIQTYLNKNRDSILDHTHPWEPLIN